ncbi:MAG: MarR family transcriptional regulator [Lentilitoribacter sp.]
MTVQQQFPIPPSLDDHICLGIYTASLAIQRTYKPLLDEMGITYPQYLVLNLLWAEDGQTVSSIARELSLELSTITPVLKRLEAAGFVTRVRNPENEREVITSLTSKGQDLRFNAGCIASELLNNSDLSVKKISEINKAVRVLRDNLYMNISAPEDKT